MAATVVTKGGTDASLPLSRQRTSKRIVVSAWRSNAAGDRAKVAALDLPDLESAAALLRQIEFELAWAIGVTVAIAESDGIDMPVDLSVPS
jgi:hypothetical protein